ncbi:vacuolar protein sorting-associated protein 54-like [Amphibalanus amphitrite]|uniref:vacuolar protein sorting-associated protein 54-like n=1 Tax=Amphibalanus amphitrite TaxID=1232801 RepID=UPI001C90A233|nr:vacuolar protein sorting-associated protein 54-like [Amphibalanus amphitrite]
MDNPEHPWRNCLLCSKEKFQTPDDFVRHLRQKHCRQEGGSFVCHYGYNRVCSSLPLEGVSDTDYEHHVLKHHVYPHGAIRRDAGSRASSVSSQSSQPSTGDGGRWSLHSAAQNLPAVLNDPSRGRQRDFFTKTWGDGFVEREVAPSPRLPDISLADFQGYLRDTTKRYKKHLKKSNSFKKDSLARVSKLSRIVEPEEDGISSVPRLFFDPTFDLSRPDMFPVICPSAESQPAAPADRAAGQPRRPSADKVLQEKLTHYLDLVEVQIARQIADKSEAFFDAMSSHDSLMEQLKKASVAVRTLRQRMQYTLEHDVQSSLRVIRGRQRRHNCERTLQKLRLMATVHQTQPTIQLLLTTSEFVGALDLIATSQEVLAQELAGLQAFKHLSSQLTEMERLIDKMVSADFVRHVTSDLNRPLDQQLAAEEEQLVAILFGMLRLKNCHMVELYKEEACTAVRAVVKQTVIEALAAAELEEPDPAEGGGGGGGGGGSDWGGLHDQVAALSPVAWLKLLRQLCDNLRRLLARVKAVSDVMEDVLDAALGRPRSLLTNGAAKAQGGAAGVRLSISAEEVDVAMLTPEEGGRLRDALSAMLPTVCDYAHERCGKLLLARVKESGLESTEFLALAALVQSFVADCEQLCGRQSSALHLALQGQASQFVQRFHSERKTKLNLLLESERWRQADVPAEFQTIADHVTNTGCAGLPSRVSCPESPERRPADALRLGEQQFVVVGTVLLLVKMLLEYCDCARHLGAASGELLSRLVDLLRFFNSRCCQLVVGAGAIQLVGLKTITSRNLSLAARGVQLVLHFIPIIRTHFQALVPDRSRSQLRHLDQVELDYRAHLSEIDSKLVLIISSACDAQLNKWEARPPVPSQQFRAVCRAVSKLHEATSGVLTAEHSHRLFTRMNAAFVESLRRRVVKLNIKSDGGPQHGLVTSELLFYQEHLKTLQFVPDRPFAEQLWSPDKPAAAS